MTTEPSPTTGSTDEWTTAPLVALDLEGSGAQERDDEAVLEIAVVPLVAGPARRLNGHNLVGHNIRVGLRAAAPPPPPHPPPPPGPPPPAAPPPPPPRPD